MRIKQADRSFVHQILTQVSLRMLKRFDLFMVCTTMLWGAESLQRQREGWLLNN
jgi:hypothetical protein